MGKRRFCISTGRQRSSGYVLMLMLFMMVTASGLIGAILYRSIIFQRLSGAVADDVSARLLAEGGLQLACGAVSLVLPMEAEQPAAAAETAAAAERPEKESLEQKWLKQLLATVNAWQTIVLTYDKDGIDAVVQLYIACEDGKIDLGYMQKRLLSEDKAKNTEDEKKEQAKNQKQKQKKLPKDNGQGAKQPDDAPQKEADFIEIISKKTQDKLHVPLKQALKELSEKKMSLDDPSDLLRLATVKKVDLTVFPQQEPQKAKKKNWGIQLMDLFTVSQENGKLNPWLLSRSTSVLLGFESASPERLMEVASKVKSRTNWAQDWDEIMSSVYGKKFESLDAAIRTHLSTQFDPRAFSVVVKIQIGQISRRLFAFLERDYAPQQNLSPKSALFRVSSIYWF